MIKQKRLIDTFLELVKIDSPSEHEDAVALALTKKLKSLGFSVQKDSFGNILAYLSGKGEPFMLNAHIDTVEPGRGIQPQIKGDIIKSDGTTVLGGDPKAGVSEILEALISLQENKKLTHALEVVFTRQEELGMVGAFNLDYKKIKSKQGITLDGEYSVAHVDIAAPGYNRVDVTITGRSAHAGVEPEKGISAIKIAADIISLLQLGRMDFETTANVGLIEGGSARNAVPESATFQAEIRSRNLKKLEKHTEHFKKVFEKVKKLYPTAKIDISIVREFDPYVIGEDHKILKLLKKVYKQMGLVPSLQKSGGGTDVNAFQSHGISSIVIGTGGYEAHTKREYVKISEMLDAAIFLEKLIVSLDS